MTMKPPRHQARSRNRGATEHAGPAAAIDAEGASRPAAPERWADSPRIAAQRQTLQALQALQPVAQCAGLPAELRAGMEALSGLNLGEVGVHYNSGRPAQLGAAAFAQGQDIHLAPGQERHLPHEAWHVVQQAQGRVRPTLAVAGVAVNAEQSLEREADIMGARALSQATAPAQRRQLVQTQRPAQPAAGTAQLIKRTERVALIKAIKASTGREFASWASLIETLNEVLPEPNAEQKLDSILTVADALEFVSASLGLTAVEATHEEGKDAELDALWRDLAAEIGAYSPFTGFIRGRLGIRALSRESLGEACVRMTAADLRALRLAGQRWAEQWEQRKQFERRSGRRAPLDLSRALAESRDELHIEDQTSDRGELEFDEYRPLVNVYDTAVIESAQELQIWRQFLDRPLLLGHPRQVAALQRAVAGALGRMNKLEARSESKDRFRLVGSHARLKALRMTLSTTLSGKTGIQELLSKGRGDEVAASSPEGGQWNRADQLMLERASMAFRKRRVQLSPELILSINREEGGSSSANSQVTGEPRFSSISLGSKMGGSYNLNLVPPSLIVPELVSLINDINYHLINIRSAQDVWQVIPIAARFYTDFIAIHPFPDGNGRTARKVVDYMLLAFGLPPAQFEGAIKNFGAGIPDTGEARDIERSFDDATAIDHMMNAVLAALDTLGG